jgi:tetratricopeptide (TPR) repeat protein
MTPEFQRAQQLRDLGRHEEAVAHLHTHLSHHPDDSMGYIELAINRMNMQGELANALEDARRATGLMAGEAFPLALQSRILSRLDREKEALPMADSAIALDPDFSYAWCSKAMALIGLSRWQEAEQCLRKALEIDPDSETASNLLSHVLRMQNRLDEAEGLFKESLRLDPNMEYARSGLKQSYRARSAFFRVFLKWSFFMQRFSEGNQIAIMIGMIIGFKVLRALFASVNPILVIPLAILYYLFIFGTWLSNGLANFFLLSDSSARLSLDKGEKAEGIAVGVLFLGGLLTLIGGLATSYHPVAVAGAGMMIAAIPNSMIYTNPTIKGRLVFGGLGALILILTVVMATDIAANPGRKLLEDTAGMCFTGIIFSVVACTWLGAVPSLRRVKES